MRRWTIPAALTALTLALFGAWMHWAVLDPRNIGWLLDGNDRGQNSLGLIAYLRARPPWPSLHDPLLMAPEGLGLALTDSNPLLAIMLRPFAGWLLPETWQYAGLWLLACVGLQVVFAWRLVRPFATDMATAWLGTALLAAMPVLFARYGHINLCAQWLILWALAIFVDPRDGRAPLRWAAVIATAGLVHPYLLVMVAAIWGSAQLRLIATHPDRPRTLVAALPAALALVAVPWLIGFLDEPLASTGTYGMFGLALDGLWNPGDDAHALLLPGSAPTVWQAFEGFNYLGAGLLLLAPVALLRGRRADAPSGGTGRLWWLAPACVVLAAVAIGPTIVWQGKVVATLPLPGRWIDALDPVRASGRLFWPAGYAIGFAIVAAACRVRDARLMLAVAAIVQLVDIGPMVLTARRTSARAATADPFVRTRDPRWAGLIAQASAIEVHPYQPYRDLALLEEVAWRAIAAPCRPVPMRWFYASREPRSVQARLSRDAARFAAGDLDPTRLYVLLDGAAPATVAGRVRIVDGVAIVPPSRPSPRCVSSSSPPAAS